MVKECQESSNFQNVGTLYHIQVLFTISGAKNVTRICISYRKFKY